LLAKLVNLTKKQAEEMSSVTKRNAEISDQVNELGKQTWVAAESGVNPTFDTGKGF